jgi:aspartate aminotransferase
LDPKRIEAAITPRTRAIVVPTPGNPTGVVLSARELGELAEICLTRGLYFVSDEVYRDFVYDQGDAAVAPSVLSLPDFDQHAVVVDSVSKRYSACGARIGALVTKNAALRSAALRFGQARLSPPTVDQWAGMAALDTPPEYMLEVVREYRQRRDTLVSGLRAIGVQCHSPAGAFYLMATLPVSDADAFCRFLLEDFALDGETVMLAPASGFYATPGLGKDEVRLAYVLECGKLSRCCEILGAALHAYGDR